MLRLWFILAPPPWDKLYLENKNKRKDLFLCEVDANAFDKTKTYELITCSSEFDLYWHKGTKQASFILDKQGSKFSLQRYNAAFYDEEQNDKNRKVQINAELFLATPETFRNNELWKSEEWKIKSSPYLFYKEYNKLLKDQKSDFLKKRNKLTFLVKENEWYDEWFPKFRSSLADRHSIFRQEPRWGSHSHFYWYTLWGRLQGYYSECNAKFLERWLSDLSRRSSDNLHKSLLQGDKVSWNKWNENPLSTRDPSICPEWYGKSLLSKMSAYDEFLRTKYEYGLGSKEVRDMEENAQLFYKDFLSFINGPLQSKNFVDKEKISWKDWQEYIEWTYSYENRNKYLSETISHPNSTWEPYGDLINPRFSALPFSLSLKDCHYLCKEEWYGPEDDKNYNFLRTRAHWWTLKRRVEKDIQFLKNWGKYQIIFEGQASLKNENLICNKSTSPSRKETLICRSN